MNKKFLMGVGVGVMAVTALEVFNKVINEYSKKYVINRTTGYYFTWTEGSIHYNVVGKGKPILLIHDLNVLASEYEWKNIVDDLSENHTVYTLDLLGCGLSDKPDITYTTFTFVQIISAFVNEVIKEKCDVITSNNSSDIVIMAQKVYDVFDKMILINPTKIDTNPMVTNRIRLIRKKILYTPILGTLLYNRIVNQIKIKATINFNLYNKMETNLLSEACYEASHINNSKGRYLYASIKCSYVSCDVRQALSEQNNIYIIIGTELSNVNAEDYQKINSDINVKTISGSKMLPHFENPEDTYRAIYQILK